MADLNHLGGLVDVEPIDLGEGYADNRKKTFRLAPKGRYTLRAVETLTAESFGRSKSGQLFAAIDPTIVGPTNEGTQLKFTRVYATPFLRNGKRVSQIGDYLRATGFRGTLANEAMIVEAIQGTAGQVFEADIDWRAFSNKGGTKFEVRGMESFPKLPDGSYQPWVNHPTEKDENDEPLRVWANLNVEGYVPASI